MPTSVIEAAPAKARSVEELHDISRRLSRRIIKITTKAGSSHPSSSLSAIDLLVALYFGGVLRHRPNQPDWPARDRFILSKGHGAPGLYAVLAEAGYFDTEILSTFRDLGSPLEGHPNMRRLSGIEATTGSLGQGLSIGLGHALAARVDGRNYHVYVMIGDGEANEGQIWEAAMPPAKYFVGNLTVILDYNKFQQTGPVDEVMPSLEPVADKWSAFGWHTAEIDGHDMAQIIDTFEPENRKRDTPRIVIAHTLKGKGLTPFERDDTNRKHGKPLEPEEVDVALAEEENPLMTALLRINKNAICKFCSLVAAVLVTLVISGCATVRPTLNTVSNGQDIFLGIIAILLFFGVLLFAAFKTFGGLSRPMDEANTAELRLRSTAFVIGILLTIIVIAADADTLTFLSISGLLALFPWYLLTLLGFGFGFALAGISYTASKYRPTSGYEFVILVLTMCGALGLYLTFTAGGLRHNVLAGISSVLVGLLSFRMLFPTGGRSRPIQKESPT